MEGWGTISLSLLIIFRIINQCIAICKCNYWSISSSFVSLQGSYVANFQKKSINNMCIIASTDFFLSLPCRGWNSKIPKVVYETAWLIIILMKLIDLESIHTRIYEVHYKWIFCHYYCVYLVIWYISTLIKKSYWTIGKHVKVKMNLHISLSSLPSVAFSSHGLLPSLFGPSFKMLLKWPSYFASSFMSGFVFQLCSWNIKLLEQLQTRSHCSVYIIVIFLISHSVVHVKICNKGILR